MAQEDQSEPLQPVQVELEDAQRLVEWINENLHEIEIKGDDRHRVPGQLFDLAIEHHVGIVRLLTSRVYGSAFALLRCEFECLIRGIWLHHCASAEELKGFIEKDEVKPWFFELVEAVEKQPDFSAGLFSKVKEAAWDAMNGYTHGGIHQISRRLHAGHIQPNFGDEELLEVIRVSGAFALIALGQIASLAGCKDLWDKVDQRLQQPPPTATKT